MRGHSMESRIFIAKNPERLSIEAHDCYKSVVGFYPKKESAHKPTLRRCESASSLARNSLNSSNLKIQGIETKYKALEESYRQMLIEVRIRSDVFSKQKEEMEKLIETTKKEEKEIVRLKEMIRINEKNNYVSKTEEQPEEHSWRKRMEVSTGESELTSKTRCDRSDIRKTSLNRERSSMKRNSSLKAIEKEKPKIAESRVNKANVKERAPLVKKYKFMPTLNFKHN